MTVVMSAPNLADWYWFVAGDTANVWSSKRAKAVPVADAAYTTWKALPNNYTTSIESMVALRDVFAAQFPPGMLETYAADARARKAGGGVIVTSLSQIAFISEPVARNTLANAYEYVKATPGNTVNWKLSNGSFIVLTEAQLQTAVTAVASFVQSCFTCESTTLTGVTGGSITTLAQIDAAFAAISNVFP